MEQLLSDADPRIRQVVTALRELVLSALPGALETADRGNLGYGFSARYRDTMFGITPHRDHVTLGFAYGAELPDPAGLLEYARPDRSVAVACIFRVSADGDDGEYTFRARGLDASRRYRVTWDSAQLTCEADGLAPMQQGITVPLDSILTSELLTFEVVR